MVFTLFLSLFMTGCGNKEKKKVIVNRTGTEEEKERLNKKWNEISFDLLDISIEELFDIEEDVKPEIPEYAPIFEDKFCTECGEKIMAPKAIEKKDKDLCVPCAGANHLQLDGRGLNRIKEE